MCTQEYTERVKALIRVNYKKEKREEEIARKSKIFYDKLAKLQKSVMTNRLRLEAATKRHAQLENANLKLRKFIDAEAEEVAQQRNKLEDDEARLVKARQIMLTQTDKLCTLKMLTGVLLKTQQAPNVLDAVIRGKDGCNANWQPIHIDFSKQSVDVIQDNFWQMLTSDDMQTNPFYLLEQNLKESSMQQLQ